MVLFSLAPCDASAPKLTVLSSGAYKCQGCWQESGVKLRNIETRFNIEMAEVKLVESEEFDGNRSNTFNALEQFMSFILELSSDWWGSEISVASNDANALASISALIPILHSEPRSAAQNAKKLLRRSYTAAKQLAIDRLQLTREELANYDVYDILTEEHFQDVLSVIAALSPEARSRVTFCFRTDLMRPTICHLHHGSIHRHLHNWKRKGFALFLKVRDLLSIHRARVAMSARLVNRFTIKLQEVCAQLPEINSLLSSGLYSRGYIEQEIDEVHSTVTDSVIKGFETLKL